MDKYDVREFLEMICSSVCEPMHIIWRLEYDFNKYVLYMKHSELCNRVILPDFIDKENIRDVTYTITNEAIKLYQSERYFDDHVRIRTNFTPIFTEKSYDINKVVFNDPATIVYWNDRTKTVVKCQEGDKYDKEKGLAMAIAKKYMGTNKSHSDYNYIFKKWIEEE